MTQQPNRAGNAAVAGALPENTAAALCYLFGVLSGVAFLVMAPYNTNRRIRFNALQSIFFVISMMASSLAVSIVSMLMPAVLAIVTTLLFSVLMLGCMAVWLFLMWKNYSGETVVLPVIGPLAEQQANKF